MLYSGIACCLLLYKPGCKRPGGLSVSWLFCFKGTYYSFATSPLVWRLFRRSALSVRRSVFPFHIYIISHSDIKCKHFLYFFRRLPNYFRLLLYNVVFYLFGFFLPMFDKSQTFCYTVYSNRKGAYKCRY